jgi:deoxyuridine 5'-triphosphate nucleotidohydrolase
MKSYKNILCIHNKQTNMNEEYFKHINSPLKAYVLGIIIYNNKLLDNKKIIVELPVHDDFSNSKINSYLRNVENIKNEMSMLGECIYNVNSNAVVLTIESEKIIRDIYEKINMTLKTSICDLDLTHFVQKNDDRDILLGFFKAYVERYGNILTECDDSKLHITFYLEKNLHHLKFMNIPYTISKLFNLNIAVFNNVNLIDFMGSIYKNEDIPYVNHKLHRSFYKILNNDMSEQIIPKLKVFKTDTNAVLPSKQRESDVGYDLTIINESKKMNAKTTLYDTGLKLDIPNGYYVEIVPRSSLSKSGYMLANSVGIIDQSYRGNLYVALTKIDEASEDIQLPFRCCQMILKKQFYCRLAESQKDFEVTDRNEGGFGSTTN